MCVGKSTYARIGIIVNVTPLEPEWKGKVTIEISNTTPLPAKVYAGEGIAQVLFFEGSPPCKQSYADKKGKYQDQKGLTLPFVVKSEINPLICFVAALTFKSSASSAVSGLISTVPLWCRPRLDHFAAKSEIALRTTSGESAPVAFFSGANSSFRLV